MNIVSYKQLIVWQKSMYLVVMVYKATKNFPREELYGITSQMRRASVSIPSNIAEGNARRTRKNYRSFLVQAFASGAELETQIELAKRLQLLQETQLLEQLLTEIMKMLNTMIQKMSVETTSSTSPQSLTTNT